MRRPTDKQLSDAIEAKMLLDPQLGQVNIYSDVSDMIAYAQHRALERIADNLHEIMEVLAVIRADHKSTVVIRTADHKPTVED